MIIQSTNKREQILLHARDLLRKQGINAFSHRELADRVGVKSSSVHYYFPTKEDIGLALIQEYRVQVLSILEALGTLAVEDRIDGFIDLFVKTASSGEDWCPAAMLASDFMTLGKELQNQVNLFFGAIERWLASQVNEFCNWLTLEQADSLAKTGIAMLEGALLLSRCQRDPSRVSHVGKAFKQLLRVRSPEKG
jgi:TetR/AcrR family transcriptional regulator, transcriptional repressor for nem operon